MKQLLCHIIFCILLIPSFSQNLSLTNLRCESTIDPLGVDVTNPRLSWELKSNQRNVLQTAYRILVSDDLLSLSKGVGNLWDSKKINSAASIQVQYSGKALQSVKKYFWKLMVWDNKGNISSWSDPAMWQMGLLNNADWNNAQWIGYDEVIDSLRIAPHVHLNGKKSWGPRRNVLPLIRKEFSIDKEIKTATTYICGLGHFEIHLNGKKIGDHFLDPGWTNYSKHAQYVTFDITNELRKGGNAFGVMLGNGFYYIPGQRYRKMTGAYGHPKMIMRTVIEYTDGSIENIISDKSWQTFSSPIIFSSIYGGEDYDTNLEQEDWDQPGFLRDGTNWLNVIITTGPEKLESQLQQPLKIMERFTVKAKTQIKPNTWMFDLGQNFSGIPAITVAGNNGDTVKIFCAELTNPDGTANQKATGSPSYFTYILKGGKDESWQPRFSYTGFRYMEVHCIPKDSLKPAPIVKNIEGLHIRNAANNVGSFTSSNELFNKTNTLIDWAIKSNTVSVFTDCPHREKLGWLEQTHLMGASVQYNYDVASLCRKVIKDMMNAQYPDGKIPEIAPEFTLFAAPFDESPEWGSAAIILPWYNYQWYGDKQTLSDAYNMMKGYLLYLKNNTKDNILSHGLGDWYDIGPQKSGFAQMTKMGITATATFYYDLTIMINSAKLLSKPDDVKMFQQLAADVKSAFNDNFFDKQKLQYDSASQTANAMALYMRLVEPQYKQAVIDALVKDIKGRNNALTAGDIGYRYVLRALEDAGRSDVIFNMNSRDDVPGYGFQLKHGATALTESWQAYESVSNNHFMLGHLMEWFFAGLAGIKQADNSVAYNKIEIKPQPVGDVTAAKATYHSVYGEIVSDWKKSGDAFDLDVEIPVNTTATIYIPAKSNQAVTANGKLIAAKYIDGKAVIKIGSGKYHFKTK
ncbi:MAG TPA: family 78 glycoside hydrolase catalytic domain [Chitinophagaceae bacterium]|nr:family 78 glycoside hydrolase catalytic domain [Chitinophagaceae bacterium]